MDTQELTDLGDYLLYLVSRTIGELNDFPHDGDIYDYIGRRLAGFTPDGTIIIVNSYDQASRKVTARNVTAPALDIQKIEALLNRSLIGLSFTVPDSYIPAMLTAECQEIRGIKALTFGWIPDDIGSELEAQSFFGKIYGAGISWREKLNGNVIFIIRPGVELENRNLITFFVRQVAGYLQRRNAEESAARQSTKLSVLNHVITAANRSEDLPSLLRKILSETISLLEYDGGGVYIIDHATETATAVTSVNLPDTFLEDVGTVSIRKSPYNTLLVNGIPIFTDHFEKFVPDFAAKTGFRSLASVPLVSRDRIVGALNVASTRRYIVSDDERDILISIGRELGTTIERLSVEEDAKKSATNLEILFNSIDEMVFILDLSGVIIQVNMPVRARVNRHDKDLIGKNFTSLHIPEQQAEVRMILRDVAADGTATSCQVPFLSNDGKKIAVETKITRGWWDNREVLIGVTRDITERKRSEDALMRANRQLSLMTSVTRHDILNKISIIIGLSSIARGIATDSQIIEYLTKIESATEAIQERD